MSQGWSKIFNRINWLNRPNTNTPLNATNLNAGDSAIDKLDDRIITLDTVKADMQVVNGMVSDVSLNESNGVLTITYKDGSTKTYDTNLEKIAVNFRYDSESERLILTMPDGSMQYIDLSALITQFEFLDSDTIAFSVDSNGKVSATIKNGSITESMLETGYLANIKVEVAKAEASATQAQSSEASSDYNEKLSQSYAIGLSGIREGENTDNAKYYNEQAQEALSKMQDAQVTGVKGNNETEYRKGEVNITAENIGAVAVGGDTKDNIISFTSSDSKNPTQYTDVDVLATGETHKSIFAKISTMFKNIRYLYKMLGSTDISSIGDGTATGAISTLNSNLNTKQDASTAINTSNISNQSVNYASSANYANSAESATNATNANVIANNGETAGVFFIRSGYPKQSGTSYLGSTTQYFNYMCSTSFYIKDIAKVAQSSNIGVLHCNKGWTVRRYDDVNTTAAISASAFNMMSSARVKENVHDITDEESKKILELEVKKFDYIEEVGGTKNQYGVIAEDVAKIMPSVVTIPDEYDENKTLKELNYNVPQVDYTKFIPHLIKMVQSQQKEIEELKELIKNWCDNIN